MSYSKVVMILNVTDYELISDTLKKLSIPGISISMVHGFGDYVNEYNDNNLSKSMKIEIYTSAKQAQEIAPILSKLTNDLTEGGGVVVIEPVLTLLNVKKLESD